MAKDLSLEQQAAKDIEYKLWNINNNLCLLIEIIAQSSINESHTRADIQRLLEEN